MISFERQWNIILENFMIYLWWYLVYMFKLHCINFLKINTITYLLKEMFDMKNCIV